jgi:nicotinamidase-related amidase
MASFSNNTTGGAFAEAPVVVAVDVQVRALAHDRTHDDAVENGAQVVRLARQLGWPVLLLKIISDRMPDNPVMPQLLRELEQPRKYERLREIEKTRMGGGLEVIAACKQFGPGRKKFIIFGFWVKGCLLATVREMAYRLKDSQFVVVRDACNNAAPGDWEYFEEIPNVQVVDHFQMAHLSGDNLTATAGGISAARSLF